MNTSKKKTPSTVSCTTIPSRYSHKNQANQNGEQKQSTQTPTRKWATFTYIGKETTFIINLFRHTNIRIAFRTNNTIHNRLTYISQKRDKYTCSGIYKLMCPECKKASVGQTGKNFLTHNEPNRHLEVTDRRPNLPKNMHTPLTPYTTW
jgi:hypothetical protein